MSSEPTSPLPNDPIASATEGLAKALIKWSEEKVKEFASKFKNKELAFIEDYETIETAKEQKTSAEYDYFKGKIGDSDLRILCQMGLTLRKLETQGKPLQPLRDKILKKYDSEGLHVAQAIQNGIFNKYVAIIIEKVPTPEKLDWEIQFFFKNIENNVVFIKGEDDVEERSNEIVTKIQANSPKTFIISSSGGAMDKCESIKCSILTKVSNYACEFFESPNRKIYFLNRKEEVA